MNVDDADFLTNVLSTFGAEGIAIWAATTAK